MQIIESQRLNLQIANSRAQTMNWKALLTQLRVSVVAQTQCLPRPAFARANHVQQANLALARDVSGLSLTLSFVTEHSAH